MTNYESTTNDADDSETKQPELKDPMLPLGLREPRIVLAMNVFLWGICAPAAMFFSWIYKSMKWWPSNYVKSWENTDEDNEREHQEQLERIRSQTYRRGIFDCSDGSTGRFEKLMIATAWLMIPLIIWLNIWTNRYRRVLAGTELDDAANDRSKSWSWIPVVSLAFGIAPQLVVILHTILYWITCVKKGSCARQIDKRPFLPFLPIGFTLVFALFCLCGVWFPIVVSIRNRNDDSHPTELFDYPVLVVLLAAFGGMVNLSAILLIIGAFQVFLADACKAAIAKYREAPSSNSSSNSSNLSISVSQQLE